MLRSILGQSFSTLRANKLRSLLAMFGIAWGILSIILMTAAGEGFKVAQRESMLQLGQDILIIWGGRTSMQAEGFQAGRDIQLKYADFETIRDHASLIRYVSPELIRTDLVAKTELNYGTFSTRGVLPEYQYMRSITAARGRILNAGDSQQSRTVCVIGTEVAQQLFESRDPIGAELKLNGHPFTVIGLLPKKELNSTYSGQDHSAIFVPYRTMRDLFSDPGLGASRELIDNLIASPLRHELYEDAERQVRQVLARKRMFNPKDDDAIGIWNTGRQVELMSVMMTSMQWFLGTVAMVTLLLGAVGVVNIMLVSVRERTREIGLRKSVGARRRDILLQFFAEALTLTLLAGGTGMVFGWLICGMVNLLSLPEMVFAGMIVSPAISLLAVFSLIVAGITAGIYPAWIAAQQDPIEALRAEAG